MTIPTAAAVTDGGATIEDTQKDHILLFPFMAKGHTIPLLHLASFLSSSLKLHVSIITTPGNAAFLRHHLPKKVDLLLLPFPHFPPLPPGVESTEHLPSLDLYPHFLTATSLLRRPFLRLLLHLHRSSSSPLCLISDFFLGWTLPICRQLSIPRLVFHGMSAFSMAICKSIWTHSPHLISDPFHVPGTPPHLLFTRREIPDTVLNSADPTDPVTQFLAEIGESDVNSWGVLVNSFSYIDREYVPLFESFYKKGSRAWLVGPLCLLAVSQLGEEDESIRWLNGQDPGSVVYVSFGTQTHVPDAQLDEVAHGLVESGIRFICVVRSSTWAPPEGLEKRGKIVNGWVPQREVLGHVATGGFVSHCGWNSVLEAVSAGVPMLTWPMIAEQHMNAKMVVEELGVGVGMKVGENRVVGRGEVRERVRELMVGGEEGRRAREKAAEINRKAREAVAEGGSSRRSLEDLIVELRKCRSESSEGGVLNEMMEREMAAAAATDPVQVELQDGILIA